MSAQDFPLAYRQADGFVRRGTVQRVAADAIEMRCPALSLGDLVTVECAGGARAVLAEVTATGVDGARCAPIEMGAGVRAGAPVTCVGARLGAYAGDALLGHALDAWGRTSDACASSSGGSVVPLESSPLPVGTRAPIERAMRTGVAAIDAFTTLGYGQRIGLAAGAGVGKTTLLRRIVEHADADVRVVALVGERAREATETCRRLRSLPCWPNTSVYCATSEASAVERFAAARSATAHAHALCRNGRRVLLVVDSLTRVAMAWRELALASGEPLTARGYPPSLAGTLARLVEQAGARRDGSITAVYTVLVEGDDPSEPVTDAVRALLDGHIVLSRRHAEASRYPAIDVLRSLSRAMPDVAPARVKEDAAVVRHALSTLEDADDLFAIGAYRAGADAWLDACVALRQAIDALVFDGRGARGDPCERLAAIAGELRRTPGPRAPSRDVCMDNGGLRHEHRTE